MADEASTAEVWTFNLRAWGVEIETVDGDGVLVSVRGWARSTALPKPPRFSPYQPIELSIRAIDRGPE